MSYNRVMAVQAIPASHLRISDRSKSIVYVNYIAKRG